MDAKHRPREWRLLNHISYAIEEANTAMKNSRIPLFIVRDKVLKVSTGCGGVGQASRHAVGVFLRGRSDVAIVL